MKSHSKKWLVLIPSTVVETHVYLSRNLTAKNKVTEKWGRNRTVVEMKELENDDNQSFTRTVTIENVLELLIAFREDLKPNLGLLIVHTHIS